MIKWFILLLTVSSVVLLLPLKKLSFLKKLMPSIIVAAAVAMAVYGIAGELIQKAPSSQVTITATNTCNSDSKGSDVTFRGAMVDGVWYWAADLHRNSHWLELEKHTLTWRPNNQPEGMTNTISFTLPAGGKRLLGFNSNIGQGIVSVDIDRKIQTLDLYSSSGQMVDRSLNIDNSVRYAPNMKVPRVAGILAFFLILALCLFFFYRQNEKEVKLLPAKEREMWGDLLRIILIFIIVWLHCTCNLYNTFPNKISDWYSNLLINSFTSFAVPCFFMLSGAFLLRKDQGIRAMLTRRIPKLFGPFLFWSVMYILVNIFVLKNGSTLLKSMVIMLFKNQSPHLWFMYSLFGIYMLLPLISKPFREAPKTKLWYAMILLLFFPALFHDAQYILNHYYNTPNFSLFWPDLGLFLWGFVVWRNRENLCRKWRIFIPSALIGFTTTVLGSYYISMRSGAPNKGFISCIGSVGNLMLATSVFVLALSLEEQLHKLGPQARTMIHTMGQLSFSVYLTHVLTIQFVGSRYPLGVGLTINTGSQLNMLCGTIMIFMITLMFCFCGSKIPVIQRLFGIDY